MADEMVWPSSTEERQTYFRMEARRREAEKLLSNFASWHGLSQVAAARSILRNLEDVGHQMDPTELKDVENYAREVLTHHRYKICVQILNSVPSARFVSTGAAGAGPRSLFLLHHDYTAPVENRAPGDFGHQMGIVDPSVVEDDDNYARWVLTYNRYLQEARTLAPLMRPVDSRGQTETIHGQRAGAAGVRSSILHRDYTALVENRATVGSRRCVLQDLGGSDSTARGYHWCRICADNGDSSRILNWSAAANPNAGTGSGGSAGDHIFIDMRASLIENSDLLGEELRETESENSWARRILETTIGTLLPAAVVNARDFFSDTPDVVKLAGNMILPALLAFCLIGMLHKRKAGSILRLATCAAIAAATLGVSSQLSDRIHAFIAVVAGVALSFTTLTA